MYDDIVTLKLNHAAFIMRPQVLDADSVEELRSNYQWLPSDYLTYLATVGWGPLGGSGYMIYSAATEPDNLFACLPKRQLN